MRRKGELSGASVTEQPLGKKMLSHGGELSMSEGWREWEEGVAKVGGKKAPADDVTEGPLGR